MNEMLKASVYLKGILPLMEDLVLYDQVAAAAIAGERLILQFEVKDGPIAHLAMSEGAVRHGVGRHPNPDVRLTSCALGKKMDEAEKRAAMGSGGGTAKEDSLAPLSLSGSLQTKNHRALFRAERLGPALQLLIISLVIVLAWLAVLECLDQSFKSERQAARYLNLATLGSLPDLSGISKTIGMSAEGKS